MAIVENKIFDGINGIMLKYGWGWGIMNLPQDLRRTKHEKEN